jgi:opacity protein-like surface antigen
MSGNSGFNEGEFSQFSFYDYEFDGASKTRTQKTFSLGEGFSFGLDGRLMFNQHIGVDLSVTRSLSRPHTVQDQYTNSTIDYLLVADSWQIGSSMIVSTADSNRFSVYMKMGVLFNKSRIDYNIDEIIGDSIVAQEYDFTSAASMGVTTSIGVNYRVSENISLFYEFSNINVSVSPDKAELMVFDINGVDELNSLSENDVTTNYVDSYSVDTDVFGNEIVDENVADTDLKFNLPFNSVGLKIGAKLSF